MNTNDINLIALKKIATALDNVNDQVVYVGGAVIGLYIDDPAADDIRPTNDVDFTLSLVTLIELENLRSVLIKKGFIQSADDQIICRFRFEGIKVDVMNTTEIGWAPANPWFGPGFQLKEKKNIG